MLAVAPGEVVVVVADEAMLVVAADQAVAEHTPDGAPAVKLVVVVVTDLVVAAVVVVVLRPAHEDLLEVEVGKSEVAPLAVVTTELAAPYLSVLLMLFAEKL